MNSDTNLLNKILNEMKEKDKRPSPLFKGAVKCQMSGCKCSTPRGRIVGYRCSCGHMHFNHDD